MGTFRIAQIATLVLLAWRNLWRNYRRTLIMLAAISVGVWAMIFLTALMRGMVKDALTRGIDSLPGYIQIHNPDYLDDPSVVNSMADPEADLRHALDEAPISEWFSRIKVPAVVSSERDTRGVQFLGIDPQKEIVTFETLTIVKGQMLSSPSDKGILIGEKLAEKLDTGLGKRIVVMSQDPSNNLAEQGFRIVGIYRAELRAAEEVNIYTGMDTAKAMLHLKHKVSEIAVFTDDEADLDSLQHKLSALAPNREVKTWKQVDGYLGSLMKVMNGFVLVWILVIFLAMSFGLANTLVMAVFERIREIGLMLALGMRPVAVTLQILFESIFMIVIGLLVGNALSFISVAVFADGIDLSAVTQGLEMAGMGSVLTPDLLVDDVVLANLVVLILGILTALLPAWRASKYDPIQALSRDS